MKKEVKKSVTPIIPSKMIMEIFIVVFGISFLFYLAVNGNKTVALVFYTIILAVVAFEVMIKSIKRTFKFNEKAINKILYSIVALVSVVVLFSIFMQYIMGSDLSIYNSITLISGVCYGIFLFVISIKCLVDLYKTGKNLLHNTVIPIVGLLVVIVFILCYLEMFL